MIHQDSNNVTNVYTCYWWPWDIVSAIFQFGGRLTIYFLTKLFNLICWKWWWSSSASSLISNSISLSLSLFTFPRTKKHAYAISSGLSIFFESSPFRKKNKTSKQTIRAPLNIISYHIIPYRIIMYRSRQLKQYDNINWF